MSKGSPIISVRIPEPILAKLDKAMDRINTRRKDMPYTRHAFILAAIMDKLAHIERSRRRAKRERDDDEVAADLIRKTCWNYGKSLGLTDSELDKMK